MLDFLSDYTRLREQNKDSELPLGTGLIQGFQPSRGLKSAFKVSSIFVPFTLLLQVSDRMHLVDSGQTVDVWRWHGNRDVADTPRSSYSHLQHRRKCLELLRRHSQRESAAMWASRSPGTCKVSPGAQQANIEAFQQQRESMLSAALVLHCSLYKEGI